MKSVLSTIAVTSACMYLATFGAQPLAALAIFVIASWGIGNDQERT